MSVSPILWRCKGCGNVSGPGEVKLPEVPGGHPSCPACGKTEWEAARVEIVSERESSESEDLPLFEGVRPHHFLPTPDEVGRACVQLVSALTSSEFSCVLYPRGSGPVACAVAEMLFCQAYEEPDYLDDLPSLARVDSGARTLVVVAVYEGGRVSWKADKIKSRAPKAKFAALYCKTLSPGDVKPDYVGMTLESKVTAVMPW